MSLLAALAAAFLLRPVGRNLVVNPLFDPGAGGWGSIWCREEGQGSASVALEPDGKSTLELHYGGKQDWAFSQAAPVEIRQGDIVQISVSARSDSEGDAAISVVLRGRAGDVIDWEFGRAHISGQHGWQMLQRKFVVPSGATSVQFRFEGYGRGTYGFRDPRMVLLGNTASLSADIKGDAHLESAVLDLTVTKRGALALTDRSDGRSYYSVPTDLVMKKLDSGAGRVKAVFWDVANDCDRTVTYELDPGGKEAVATVSGEGDLSDPLAVPGAIKTDPGQWLIVPMNEGIFYPVDDSTIGTNYLVSYGGHGICMPWFGVLDPKTGSGLLSILETPDDAAIRIERPGGSLLRIQPVWEASRGTLRYSRRIRLVPIQRGGYVAMAARYRSYAQKQGLLVSLREKRVKAPAVDRLVGAINIWTWSTEKLKLCREMKSMGMDRVLWSGAGNADEIKAINDLGFLSSRYDIFQDVWDPKVALSWMNTAGWPSDLVLLPDGSWMKGWAHPDKQSDGTIHWIQGGVISSPCGLARAKQTIPAELAKIPYRCRFIDTTTASPWREDYNPLHPLTRTDDRKYKMALLEFCSKNMGLVVGSETGVDASVPYLEYYEGMMSLGPYRLPDAGTDMMAYRKPTEEFLKFQVGAYYRLPLWELVYHDCTVAQWYWGDASNKAPEVWNRRDLFNILYGTAPLVMFDDEKWSNQRDRILKTYRDVCLWTRKIGYDTMVSHEFLTSDHNVQRTRWSSGHWCVVNFGDKPAQVGNEVVPAMGFRLH
jgi:hypothetical protein